MRKVPGDESNAPEQHGGVVAIECQHTDSPADPRTGPPVSDDHSVQQHCRRLVAANLPPKTHANTVTFEGAGSRYETKTQERDNYG